MILVWGAGGSISGEAGVTEHFEPMGMGFSMKQLGGTLADAFRVLAPQKPAMIEEELQQRQILRSQMASQEEIVAEPAVEVLDHGTGADRAAGQGGNRFAHGKEAAAQLSAQEGLAANGRDLPQPAFRR